MKTLYLLGIISVALILQGCASLDNVKAADTPAPPLEQPLLPPSLHHHKDPIKVSFIAPEKKLALPYQVVGRATVSKYNVVGVKRQEATIRDIMRQLAASLDGDAVIDMQKGQGVVTATVITYKNVLV